MDVPNTAFNVLVQEVQNIEHWHEPWLPWYHESHLALVIGHALLNAGASYVVPEVKPLDYPKGERCDLFAKCDNEAWYMEIKKGWHGVTDGWQTKPGEQLGGWLWDLIKLHRITDAAAHRCFVLVHARQHDLSKVASRLNEKNIHADAVKISDHLKAGLAWDDLPLPASRMNSWKAMALLEAVLQNLGKVHLMAEPFLGTDFEQDGKKMEHRIIVGCF